MKKLLLAIAALSLVVCSIPAKASNCTTTCNTNRYTGQQTCNTYCY